MIDELNDTGFCALARVPWVGEFTGYLDTKPRWAGHVKARPRHGIFCNSMADVIAAPHFLEYAKNFTPVASKYFGEQAHLWSLNAFYTDADTPFIPGVNGLHCDREAEKILVLFMLGRDTGPDGAQLLMTRPHSWAAMWGQAGTAWLADTTMPHCGLLPKKPRMIAWARWANVVPQAKFDEQLPEVE